MAVLSSAIAATTTAVPAVATGRSLTGTTSIATAAGAEARAPSLTVNVKPSSAIAFGLGV